MESEVIKDSITDKLKSELDINLLEKEERKIFFLENKLIEKNPIKDFLITILYRIYKIITLKIIFKK